MKQLLTIFAIYFITLAVCAQSNVFVLMDVSKSVKQNELNDAKQALNEVLTGSSLTKAFISQGKQQDLSSFKLVQGDKLAISNFGSLQTTLAINPNPTTIQNISADVNQVINSVNWSPSDNQTYITLAKAKIAEYAKNHQISRYRLYIISDNINDDYGMSGKPSYPDDYTRNLAEGYNTSTNPVNEAGYTKIKFASSSLFSLSFSPNVDVSKYNLPGTIPPAIVDTNSSNAVITITSPPEAKKNKEYELNSESLNVSWTCSNCPEGIKYTVMVSEYDGGKFRETKKSLAANSVKFKVPDGKFRITVSSGNYPATSDFTCVNVSTSSYGWFLALILIASASATGYYFWNKKRQEKIDLYSSNKTDDFFSSGNGSATTNNSTNSDYF